MRIVSDTCETTSSLLKFTLWGSQQEETEKKGRRNLLLFKEIIAENVPNLGKETDLQVQEEQRVPNKMNPKWSIPKHIITKMAKIKEKDKILKAARGKALVTYKGTSTRLLADFSAEILQARRE